MISGTKISQLPVVTVLQNTDYFPIARGATTNRISGLTLNNAALSTIKANLPIDYISNTFLLSAPNVSIRTNFLTLSGTQVIETSSSSAALRITQTGTGNAILVEDSTNPDTTPFVINQYGQICSGTLSAWNALAGLQITSDSSGSVPDSTFALKNNSNVATGSRLIFYKGRGTHSVPLELSANDNLGDIAFFGYSPESTTGNAPRYHQAAQILVQADGTPVSSLSSNPTRIIISTTLSGNSSVTERLRITHDGKVGIGTTTPNQLLTVSGNISANTIYSYISGNSETSTKWQIARNIALSGSILGNTTIDGTQNTTIFTTISTGVIVDTNIANNANISDTKLATIVSQGKVSPTAIDYTGSKPNQVLTSTGSATIWQDLSSLQLTILSGTILTPMLGYQSVTTEKIADYAITTDKLSANSVSTSIIQDSAITTAKILNNSVTLEKTTAYASAVPNSLVSRDLSGNLSAVEVTADLKGNARTATALQTPMTLLLKGVVTGQVTFDGSQTAVLTAGNLAGIPIQPWATYNGIPNYSLTGTYVQGSGITESNYITITLQNTSQRVQQDTYNFLQQDDSITINLTSVPVENIRNIFLTYNLLTGTPLTAVFTNQQAITGTYTSLPSGEYIIQSVTQDLTSVAVTLSTNLVQYITGNAGISYNYKYFNVPFNIDEGHIIGVNFLSSSYLSGGTFTRTISNAICPVTNFIDSYSIMVSTNSFQAASGIVLLPYNTIFDTFGVLNVSYIDTGHYILNFNTPFLNNNYCYTGSIRHCSVIDSNNPQLSSFYTSHIQNYIQSIKDPLNLELFAYVDNRKDYINAFNFDQVHVSCLGNQGN